MTRWEKQLCHGGGPRPWARPRILCLLLLLPTLVVESLWLQWPVAAGCGKPVAAMACGRWLWKACTQLHESNNSRSIALPWFETSPQSASRRLQDRLPPPLGPQPLRLRWDLSLSAAGRSTCSSFCDAELTPAVAVWGIRNLFKQC